MHNKFMQAAIDEALKTQGDIPVGAVVVRNGEIIAKAHNTKLQDNDITSHAEILALRKASKLLENWRLEDCDIYVTLEPCPMCGWAILQSRIRNLYFGSYDNQYGAFSVCKLENISNFSPNIYGGIREDDCDKILQIFFKKMRKN